MLGLGSIIGLGAKAIGGLFGGGGVGGTSAAGQDALAGIAQQGMASDLKKAKDDLAVHEFKNALETAEKALA